MKKSIQLERYFKGAANHWRIDILRIIEENDGISVDGIVNGLGGNFKTLSQHTRNLVHSGLVNKRYVGRHVIHALSPYGRLMLKAIKSF